MLAYSGYWTHSRALEDARTQAEEARAQKRKHRSLARWERLVNDLEKVEALIRNRIRSHNEPKRNIAVLLRRRNRIVDMLNDENRKAVS